MVTRNIPGGTQPVSGTFWQATQPVSGPLTDAQLRASAVPVSGTFWQATQPVSAASLPLPTGASTEATLALIKAKTDNIDVALSTRTKPADTQVVGDGGGSLTVDGTVAVSGSVAVTGPLTDAQLRAAVVPISDGAGSLTVDAPAGTPVFARLSDGAAALIGQKVMATSLPVVIASDQTVIPVSDNAGSLTVDAPVGTPAFVRLSDGSAAMVGQKAMAASLPAVLASDQMGTAIPGLSDSALPVRPINNNRVTAATALGALNAAVTLALDGMPGAGLFIGATTLVGTLIYEATTDGATWLPIYARSNLSASAQTKVNPSANTELSFILPASARQVRVRVSAYTSGSALVTITGTATVSGFALPTPVRRIFTQVVANPGSGNEIGIFVPPLTAYRIIGFNFNFNCSSVAADRSVTLMIANAGTFERLFQSGANGIQVASQNRAYVGGSGFSAVGRIVEADIALIHNERWAIPMPADFWVPPSCIIATATIDLQTTDSYDTIAFLFESRPAEADGTIWG